MEKTTRFSKIRWKAKTRFPSEDGWPFITKMISGQPFQPSGAMIQMICSGRYSKMARCWSRNRWRTYGRLRMARTQQLLQLSGLPRVVLHLADTQLYECKVG